MLSWTDFPPQKPCILMHFFYKQYGSPIPTHQTNQSDLDTTFAQGLKLGLVSFKGFPVARDSATAWKLQPCQCPIEVARNWNCTLVLNSVFPVFPHKFGERNWHSGPSSLDHPVHYERLWWVSPTDTAHLCCCTKHWTHFFNGLSTSDLSVTVPTRELLSPPPKFA